MNGFDSVRICKSDEILIPSDSEQTIYEEQQNEDRSGFRERSIE